MVPQLYTSRTRDQAVKHAVTCCVICHMWIKHTSTTDVRRFECNVYLCNTSEHRVFNTLLRMYRFGAASLTSAHAVPCLNYGDSLKLMGFSSKLLFAVVRCIPTILVLGQPSQSLPTISRRLKIPPTELFYCQHNIFSWVL